jgi:hypothetical protein
MGLLEIVPRRGWCFCGLSVVKCEAKMDSFWVAKILQISQLYFEIGEMLSGGRLEGNPQGG